MRVILLVAAALLAVACGSGSDRSAELDRLDQEVEDLAAQLDAASTTTQASAGSTIPAPPTVAPTTEGAPTTTEPPVPDTSGWLTIDAFAGHSFDSAPLEEAIATAASVLGPPTNDKSMSCGAGQTRLVSWAGLTLLSGGSTVQGWTYSGSDPPMSTPSGATSGTTIGQLREIFPDGQFDVTTLGTEFSLTRDTSTGPRFLGAGLTGMSSSDTVASLYAGLTCFFE